MAQDNPYAKYVTGGTAPQAPAPPASIPGTITPLKQAAEARAQSGEIRAQQDQSIQMERLRIEQEKNDREKTTGTVEERKAGAFLMRAMGANESYEGIDTDPNAAGVQAIGPYSVPGRYMSENLPGVKNSLPTWLGGDDANRQVANTNQDEFVAATLRMDSGAAIPEQELERQKRIYFPQPGDGPEAIAAKRNARLRALEGLKQSAGRLETVAEERYRKMVEAGLGGGAISADGTAPPTSGTTPPAGGDGQPFTTKTIPGQEAPLPVGDMSGMQQVATGATRNAGAPEIENRVNQMWLQGRSMDEINGFLSANGYEQALVSPNAAEAKYWRRKGEGPFQLNRAVPNEGRSRAAASPAGSYFGGAADAMSFGFSDELAGAAAAATGGDYTQARDRFQGNKQAMAELNPISSLAGNVSGALLTGPAGRIAGLQVAPNATRAAGAAMAANPVATSAGMGALYGAGSMNDNRLTGAVLGGALGGVVGKGLQTVTPPIANALAERAAQRQAARVIPNAPEVAAAGQAEGVTVNRAMIDPRLENRVSGVDASLAGGPALRRGMNEVEGQIEGRVNALGRGGNVMDNATAGQTYQAAGERIIKDSGKSAAAKYTRAERLAGDAKVAPQESLQAVDDAIARLSETPSVNAAEITFLNTLKSDLSKDLSVGGLRRMRTSLRKKISNGGLVFGEDEARVLGIMDAAATDIRNGLQSQGKAKAAKAFDLADKEYRGRMEFINGTLQKIIGKRGSNLSSEQVANNLSGMARGRDTEGVKAFLAKLNPDEHADVAATFADSLGRNNRGDFSIAHFLTQTSERKFPNRALATIFGDDGAQSIKNLRLLGNEVDRVNKMRNTSNTARAADYRSAVINTLLGLGSGFGSGSVTTGIATTALAGGVKAGRDMLSARMLLNPKITKWIATAPRTTDPAAINAHIGRLESMSRAGTIGRMDAQAIQDYLRAAVGQSPGRAAAEDEGN